MDVGHTAMDAVLEPHFHQLDRSAALICPQWPSWDAKLSDFFFLGGDFFDDPEDRWRFQEPRSERDHERWPVR